MKAHATPMLGIGAGELLFIALLLLLVVGPSRMPIVVKAAARTVREFRRHTRELQSSIGLDNLLAEDEQTDLRFKASASPKPVERDAVPLSETKSSESSS